MNLLKDKIQKVHQTVEPKESVSQMIIMIAVSNTGILILLHDLTSIFFSKF